MFTRLALVAVLAASIPMMGASTADAAPGKNRGERAEKVRKGKKARAVKSTASKSRTTRSTKKTKNMVITTTRRTSTSRNGNKSTKVIVVKKYKDNKTHGSKRYMGLGKFPTYFGYGKRKAKRGGACVAAAKSRAGFGKRLIGIKGKKYGAHACDRAMNECRRELKFRKASGRNPYARCVIISRG